ncbi:MAG: radical SAM protein [bacterium]
MKKILLLNPPSLKGEIFMKEIGRCGRKAVGGERWPQTGLAYLAAVAEQSGWNAALIDAMAEDVDYTSLEARVRDFSPDLIVAICTTPTLKNDSHVLSLLKKASGAVTGFTGTHVSALPAESLKDSDVDFVMINESEVTLGELLECMKSDGFAIRGLSRIAGMAVRGEDGIALTTPPRPLVENLDIFPNPARHLLPNHAYRMPFFEDGPFATVIPTRGCPWPCTFCRAGRVWGREIRTRSPEHVHGELTDLAERLGIRNVVFMTDSLTLNRQWARKFFHMLIEKGPRITWICNSRVDVVDKEMLRLMKEAGCKLISYGVESGNQEVLNATKKQITLEQSERAIKNTRDAGILSMAYFILGLPGETPDTINETIAFAKKIDPDYVNFHVATPFPGTELYDLALEKQWIASDNWDDFEEEGSAVMRTDDLSPEDLKAAQRRAMREFYLRPRQIARELGRLRSFAQFRAKLNAGVSILRTLTAFQK